ncbi:polysaccharide deacetylase family protein [Arthrobacter sp. JSM 101049]|uniref:polysaccharide deacetylase family protein n=1 Tax=Arthrobacter sp. JSM 101049 TaxID=929097 RepID=UPI00356AE786
MISRPRSSRLCLGAALVAAALAGCAVSPGASLPRPLTAAGTPAPIGDGTGLAAAPGLGLLEGSGTRSRVDEHHHIHARWFTLEDEPAFGRGQEQAVDQEIAAFRALRERDSASAPPSELNISSAVTARSARMVGIRQTAYAVRDSSGSSAYRTLWYDREDRNTLDTRDLFASDRDWSAFGALVADDLAVDPDVFPDRAADPDPVLLDSVNFDAAGNALVEFDDGSVAPAAASPVVARVGSAALLPLLSDRGLAVRAAGMDPAGAASSAGPAQETARQDAAGPPVAGTVPSARRSPDCGHVKCIALTFEDGPGPETGRLLSILEEHDALATFFVVGPQIGRYGAELRQAVAAGHEIGNHGWSHRALTSMPAEQARRELGRTDDAIAAATGASSTLMRPPYGATSPEVNRLAHTPVALWDVDPLDWVHHDPDLVVDAVLRRAHPGAIVLLHGSAGTAESLPRILAGLGGRGYHFVTVSELLAPMDPEAQVAYTHGAAGK